MTVYRPLELELKGQVMTPMDVLVSATRVNAELLRLDDRIGTVAPGKEADLIAVDGNPLDDLRLFQDPERLHLVMRAGAIYREQL
jgi:imidazolonepropionase-like amidohydrolase